MAVTENDYRELRDLEESMWQSQSRFKHEYMDRLLAPDFFEFGRSGRRYSREETLNAPYQKIKARLPLKNFSIYPIDETVALVTYTSEIISEGVLQVANRSSLWLKKAGTWQIKFHQGTPIPR